MSYLIDKFKGKYRLRCDTCLDTNDYPRKLNGTFEDIDVYIDCSYDNKIFYYGHSILEAYIPSVGRGKNIIRHLYFNYINPDNVIVHEKDNKKTYEIIDEELYEHDLSSSSFLFDIRVSDAEVMFKFYYKNSDEIIPLLKPKTVAANRSPFSSKNLPKSNYVIPEEDLAKYREIINPLLTNDNFLALNKITQKFVSEMQKKKAYRDVDIKAVMKKKMLKGKDFIHVEGYWEEYLKFCERYIEDLIC